ncbi:unnamed protein product [Rotaria socialis]|uniref:Uncharacterized protein n=2 Tax=Rotaria socialis TaxID=392032 RepID=A0A820Z393_9BILA|nr:unnamed protein product [Rotaria socialis]CAF4558567.1 unnamed protein product [Rotaria socialis]
MQTMNNTNGVTNNDRVGEFVDIANYNSSHVNTSQNINSTRTYTPPLMGTYARAAKSRIDGDMGPIRIDGTDTYNEQLQHHYQNVRQIMDAQQSNQTSKADQPRSSSNTRQDFFDQQVQSSTYDSPPLEQKPMQKLITTITTTTTSTLPTLSNRTNSLNRLSSIEADRALEQPSTNVKTIKSDFKQQLIANEHTERQENFVDSNNQETRRLINFPLIKTTGATDLDKAQAQFDNVNDDHQAIQQLTRALHDHNKTTVNEYKRLPSQTNTGVLNTTITTRTTVVDPKTKPVKSEFTVIDALLANPLAINDDKHNNALHKRFNDIISNLRNSECVNLLKPSTGKETTKNSPKTTTVEIVTTPLKERQTESVIEPILNSSEQTPLLNAKDKKKQDKENKKKTKIKSKQLSKNEDYQVIDALINNPTSVYLPDEFLTKYKVIPPSSPLFAIPGILSDNKGTQSDPNVKIDAVHYLAKIIKELTLHHAAALTASTTITKVQMQKSTKPIDSNESIQQQQVLTNSNQLTEKTPLPPGSSTPRIVYRYMDDQGNVLKLSSTPPSKLRETIPEQSQQYFYRKMEPTHTNTRQITRDDERMNRRSENGQERTLWHDDSRPTSAVTRANSGFQDKRSSQLGEQSQQYSCRKAEPTYIPTRDDDYLHRVPGHEQRVLWHDDSKPTRTLAKENLQFQDQNRSKSCDRPLSEMRAAPVPVEHRHSGNTSPREQHTHHHNHYPNQENISLTWLPLSHQCKPTGCDTDSTIHERTPMRHTHDYVPTHAHCHHNKREVLQNAFYDNHPTGHAYYPSPPPVSCPGPAKLPEHGCNGCFRNYIEVFRDGAALPSEVYSVPLDDSLSTNCHGSFYDQYDENNDNNSPRTCLLNRHNEKSIPSKPNHNLHHQYNRHSSPNRDYIYIDNYLPQSKSFDYRPLRTKLQREHNITPRLLVDEWDNSQQNAPTGYNK